MKIEINIEKKHLIGFIIIGVLLFSGFVIADTWNEGLPFHTVLFVDRISSKEGNPIEISSSVDSMDIENDLTVGRMDIENDLRVYGGSIRSIDHNSHAGLRALSGVGKISHLTLQTNNMFPSSWGVRLLYNDLERVARLSTHWEEPDVDLEILAYGGSNIILNPMSGVVEVDGDLRVDGDLILDNDIYSKAPYLTYYDRNDDPIFLIRYADHQTAFPMQVMTDLKVDGDLRVEEDLKVDGDLRVDGIVYSRTGTLAHGRVICDEDSLIMSNGNYRCYNPKLTYMLGDGTYRDENYLRTTEATLRAICLALGLIYADGSDNQSIGNQRLLRWDGGNRRWAQSDNNHNQRIRYVDCKVQ